MFTNNMDRLSVSRVLSGRKCNHNVAVTSGKGAISEKEQQFSFKLLDLYLCNKKSQVKLLQMYIWVQNKTVSFLEMCACGLIHLSLT